MPIVTQVSKTHRQSLWHFVGQHIQCGRLEGDIGRMEDGQLELLGRRGNVSKLANGLFVSVETLEEKYVPRIADEL